MSMRDVFLVFLVGFAPVLSSMTALRAELVPQPVELTVARSSTDVILS